MKLARAPGPRQHVMTVPPPPLAGIPPPAFRLPDTTTVGRVSLQVADLERALGFYRDLLGFNILERQGPWGGKRAVLGSHGGATRRR